MFNAQAHELDEEAAADVAAGTNAVLQSSRLNKEYNGTGKLKKDQTEKWRSNSYSVFLSLSLSLSPLSL